jgi:hypothetical protein
VVGVSLGAGGVNVSVALGRCGVWLGVGVLLGMGVTVAVLVVVGVTVGV